jgi:hypothetical protein
MVSIYRDVSSDEQETLRTLSKEENKPIYREKKLINENIENIPTYSKDEAAPTKGDKDPLKKEKC